MGIEVRVVITIFYRKMRFRITPAVVRFEGVDRFPDRERDVVIGPGPKPYADPLVLRSFHDKPTPALSVETSSVRVRILERRAASLVGVFRCIAVRGY
jgi:hypothetical protein